MTQVSREDVTYLARLTAIALSDEEIEGLRVDIASILGYVDKLKELDTSGVEPTYQVTDLENVWRSDVVDDYGVSREELLKLAPEVENNQIKVPKVL